MMLTLGDFEQVIDPTILQRGRSYYADGRVVSLEEVEEGRWQAEVEGSEVYQVGIAVAPDGSVAWECDCPYDWGPICKHVAAMLYALTDTAAAPPAQRKGQTRAGQLRAALDTLTERERYELLLEIALEDRELAQLILARYGPVEETDPQALARLVEEALYLGYGRYGFLDYAGARKAAKGVNKLLDRAGELHGQGRVGQALPLYQAVLEGVVQALGGADDSTGALGGCMVGAVDGLRAAAEVLPPAERKALFEYCLAKAPAEPLADWDWAWDLIELAAQLLETPAEREAVLATLDQMAARHPGDARSGDYDRERAAMMKLAIIREHDGDAAAQAFMETQVGHEKMRRALARLYLQRGDLAAARRLCLEWLEDPPPDKPGLRHGFLEILLDVAIAGEDRAEQTRLSEALFLDTGRFEYYRRLKGLVGEQEWAAFRPGFLQRIRQGQHWRVNLGELCVAEEMWEALLHFVAAHPESIGRYHDVLAPHFPRELSQMYEQLARATLAREMNRIAYQQVCNYLQQMQALGERERVSELVAEFRVQYKPRRALREELDRAFGKSQP